MERIRSFLTSKNRKIEIPDSRQFGIGCRHCLLVETDGFEPSTPCMSSMYSNQLSYASKRKTLYHSLLKNAIAFLKRIKKFHSFVNKAKKMHE